MHDLDTAVTGSTTLPPHTCPPWATACIEDPREGCWTHVREAGQSVTRHVNTADHLLDDPNLMIHERRRRA